MLEPKATALAKGTTDEAVFGESVCDLSNLNGAIHLVGIGGIGMSALARLLLGRGIAVTGTDKSQSTILDELTDLGAQISVGHDAQNIKKAVALTVSTAIAQDNPEVKFAREHNLPIWHRSQLLAALCKGKKVIAVSGTHGKTTTTGMVAQVLLDSDLDPSIAIGGIFNRIGSNARAGQSEYFVAESDESDGTHARLHSYLAVLTNLEGDHLENYPGGLAQIQETMLKFLNNASHRALLCLDDAGCRAILSKVKVPVLSYGVNQDARYRLESLPGPAFKVFEGGSELGVVKLAVPGEHNKLNALAAIVVGLDLGLTFAQISSALSQFRGVDRRFQIIGEEDGVLVVDDYAHHPTEVQAVLKAARQFIEQEENPKGKRRLVILFQPHQPGRLRDFWVEFLNSLNESDLALIADVYIARGAALPGVNSSVFTEQLQHPAKHYLRGPTSELPKKLLPHLQPNDLILTVGAGDVTGVGPELLKVLKASRS